MISWLVVGVLRALPRHAAAARRKPHGRRRRQPHELFDTPFYTRFRALGELVRARTAGSPSAPPWLIFVLGIVGMGKVQQQFFPDSSRPEILVDLWLPEGTSFAANRGGRQALRAAHAEARPASKTVTHVGRQRRAALLPAARPDLSADQRQRRCIVLAAAT